MLGIGPVNSMIKTRLLPIFIMAAVLESLEVAKEATVGGDDDVLA